MQSRFFCCCWANAESVDTLLQQRGMPELSVSYLDRRWKRGGGFFLSHSNSFFDWTQYMCLVLQTWSGPLPEEMLSKCYSSHYSLWMHCSRYSKHNVGHILVKSIVAAETDAVKGVNKTYITTTQVTTTFTFHIHLYWIHADTCTCLKRMLHSQHCDRKSVQHRHIDVSWPRNVAYAAKEKKKKTKAKYGLALSGIFFFPPATF